jgi:uncharacterized protein (TIGR00730 family)
MRTLERVCVFCGSSSGARPEYLELAAATGRALAEAGIGVVYGGGSLGLMGAVARAAMESGGHVTGIMPRAMLIREGQADFVSDLQIVSSMHERKATMAQLSDGFVTLPGGFGTFEELCEMVTWQILGIHPKPIVVLNAFSFFDPLLAQFDHAVAEGFIRPHQREAVVAVTSVDRVIPALKESPIPESHAFVWSSES